MAQYIDKDALMAEIERRKNICKKLLEVVLDQENQNYYQGKAEAYKETLDFIGKCLKVGEGDLEGEVESYWKQCDLTWCRSAYTMSHIRIMLSDIAKHLSELGLKTEIIWKN